MKNIFVLVLLFACSIALAQTGTLNRIGGGNNSNQTETQLSNLAEPPATESIETANFTATVGQISAVNTSSGAITGTPPGSPSIGDRFQVADATCNANTQPITIDFVTAGQLLHSSSQNYIIVSDCDVVEFIYIGTTTGWIAISSN